jgi:Holliday junction resolvase RusA-like endonuclease
VKINKTILNITPQTHVRATQGDRVFFKIPRDRLKPAGLKRLQRLERYNEYKVSLLALTKEQKFIFPYQGASIRFFIPVPNTWPKWKKNLMHGKLHTSKPDLSNLLKAVEDALFLEDKMIAHYGEVSKFWVNNELGWIEIIVSDPVHEMIEVPPTRKPKAA